MILEAILLLVNAIALWMLAVFAHELGHAFYIAKVGKLDKIEIRLGFMTKKVYLKTGEPKDYINIIGRKYSYASLMGVFTGLLVIVASAISIPYSALISFTFYMYGCRTDLYKAYLNWSV